MAYSLWGYGLVSTTLLAWVVVGAFRSRPNFFSAAVHLSKSNACMLILWNWAIFITIATANALQRVFFGSLRPIEREVRGRETRLTLQRLSERSWYAITETLLALTIFRDEFDTSFIVLFISLLFVKSFHWLTMDRVELVSTSSCSPDVRRWNNRRTSVASST